MAGQIESLGQQLYQQGLSTDQIASQIQEQLLNNTIAQDNNFTTALGTFTAALAGGAPTIKLSVG
jgi:hypothetical protein